MNETNLLAGVEVQESNGTFLSMFELQKDLQTRLGSLPSTTVFDRAMAKRCIYWGHCIRAEIDELMEWAIKQTDPTWMKELQMEAIDIVHFVFNIGLELGLTGDIVAAIEADYTHNTWPIDMNRLRAATLIIESRLIELVNLLPWKDWKTYTSEPDLPKVYETYRVILISMLMLCNSAGLNRVAIIDMYYAKNRVNHERQDNGY